MNNVFKKIFILLMIITTIVVFNFAKDKPKKKQISYPEWFTKLPVSNEYVYAVGIGQKENLALSREAAILRARAELSRTIEVKISSMIKDFIENSNYKNKNSVLEFSQSVSKQISENVIIGSKIKDSFIDDSTTPETVIILMYISVKDIERSIEETKKKRESEYSKISTDLSLEKLVSEIKGNLKSTFGIKDKSEGSTQVEKKDPLNTENIKVNQGKEPAWVKKFPADKNYFIGIGNGGTLQQAQDAAINTLITQIKAKVKSELNDYMREVKGVTEEEVTQSIKITVRETVEDLELVDTWYSVDKGYWVYYRLNIEEYRKKQLQKMENAKMNALDFLKKADEENDPALAFRYAFMGYYHIAPYVTNALKGTYNGKEIIIVNELTAKMQKIMKDFNITSTRENVSIARIAPTPVEVKFKITNKGIAVSNFPVRFRVNKGGLEITEKSATDYNGEVSCIVSKVKDKSDMQSFVVELDLSSFLEGTVEYEDEQDFYMAKILNLGLPSKEVIVQVEPLVFNFVIKMENDLLKDPQYKSKIEECAANFKNEFSTKTGAKFTDSNSKVTMIMNFNAYINKSDMSGQIFTRLTVTVRIIDNTKNNEVFSKATPEIKEGSVTELKSIQNALNTYLKDYNKKMVEKVLEFFNN